MLTADTLEEDFSNMVAVDLKDILMNGDVNCIGDDLVRNGVKVHVEQLFKMLAMASNWHKTWYI